MGLLVIVPSVRSTRPSFLAFLAVLRAALRLALTCFFTLDLLPLSFAPVVGSVKSTR